jgi:integrase
MPHPELPSFMQALRAQEGIAARCLEFLTLTCARSGEALGAKWHEIDLERKIWTVPASRMKSAKEHRAPLSDRAIAILQIMKPVEPVDDNAYVFPGTRHGRPLINQALFIVLRRMGQNVTAHGFRSSFRDWAAEKTSYPAEACELALAHKVGSAVELAYRRGDLLERRRRLFPFLGIFQYGRSTRP